MMRTFIEQITQITTKFQIMGPILWHVFVCDLLFGTSEGHPLDRSGPPLGHLWSDILHWLDEFSKHCTPNVKDPKATLRCFVDKWHEPHLQKQARL